MSDTTPMTAEQLLEKIQFNKGYQESLNKRLEALENRKPLAAERLLEKIQDELSGAVQLDLEQGVAWMNEAAHSDFAKEFPLISKAISTILKMELEDVY